MKILCAGDLHLGRRPSRLPADISLATASVAARWLYICELAARTGVDVVALSGDLVDRSNRYFEAYGPLEKGIRLLADAGITTVAVAGNHDFDVLPRIARTLPPDRFHLLGEGGTWECVPITSAAGERLDVHGWSFPSEHVPHDPLDAYQLIAEPEVPTLGLLHCDLDAPSSRYAPTSSAALRNRPPGLWLLGHLHQPKRLKFPGAADLLYPGSPQPLDPGEPGPHGVWIVETAGGGFADPLLEPVATVRYDAVHVGLEGVISVDEVQPRLIDAIEAHRRGLAGSGVPLEYLSCRIVLEGRTRITHRELEANVSRFAGDLDLGGDIRCGIDKVLIETRPAVDLIELARAADAPGFLARLLLQAEDPEPDPLLGGVIGIAEATADEVARSSGYLLLRNAASGSIPPPASRDVVRTQAYRLLEELLAQKEAG